jgi:hypothetical protein
MFVHPKTRLVTQLQQCVVPDMAVLLSSMHAKAAGHVATVLERRFQA